MEKYVNIYFSLYSIMNTIADDTLWSMGSYILMTIFSSIANNTNRIDNNINKQWQYCHVVIIKIIILIRMRTSDCYLIRVYVLDFLKIINLKRE